MVYLALFISFFKIGLFGFGGGLAILSLIQMEVESHGWMTQQEFVDIVAVSQVTPGPIGINCATYVGYTVGGLWGSILSTFAIVLPSLIIMLSICKVYFRLQTRYQGNPYFDQTLRMLRFTVIGLIASAALLLMNSENFGYLMNERLITIAICVASFWIVYFTRVHPILVIILAGITGLLVF